MGTAGCWNGNVCLPMESFCPPGCNEPAPTLCPEGEKPCDMGSNAGCWMGNNCLPEEFDCPPVCHHAAPMPCPEGEMSCDLGTSAEGCWMGNNCHPETVPATECPPPVYS